MAKRLHDTIELQMPGGRVRLQTVQDVLDQLASSDWPNPGPRHRDAVETCLKVQDGHRSVIEVNRVIADAAEEAGFSVS